MQCPACRRENPAQAKSCLECGARLALGCSHCGTELPASAKFCLECGERVTPSRAEMLSTAASAEAYTPRHLAARILTATAALEGERKQVAVLFADLKGSMELLADRDPEDARNHGFTFAEGVRAAVSAHLERCSQQLRRELVLITEQGDHCEDTRNPEDHFE